MGKEWTPHQLLDKMASQCVLLALGFSDPGAFYKSGHQSPGEECSLVPRASGEPGLQPLS